MSTRKLGLAQIVLLLLAAALLPACGDDGGDEGEAADTSATTTTLPDAAFSTVALEDRAIEMGEALLARDVGHAWALMSVRCRAMIDRDELGPVLDSLGPVLKIVLKPDVEVSAVSVTGAITGEMADGRGEASVQLNQEVFTRPELAVFPMAPYVFEHGEWRYDACEQLLSTVGLGSATTAAPS